MKRSALVALLVVGTALAGAGQASAAANGTAVAFSATQGVEFTGTVAQFSEIDDHLLDTGPSATIDWGDGTSSSGTVSGSRETQAYAVAGTHTYAGFGSFQVTVTLLWHDFDMPRQTVAAGPTATVASGLSPIPVAITTSIGQAFSGTVGQFRDDRTGATGDRTRYAASIDWGDGTPRTGGEIDLVAGTTFRVVSGHRWSIAGRSIPVRVFITSVDAAATTIPSTALVAGDPAPAIGLPTRPCANIPLEFRSVTTASPGAPIVDHQWTLSDPSAFAPPNGGRPFDTGSTETFTFTFGYSSLEFLVGSAEESSPPTPTRLFRKPVGVTLRVQDVTGQVRSVSRTIRFIDDGYRPTEAHPTPSGCGVSIFSRATLGSTTSFKVKAAGAFGVGVGCARIADCLARVLVLPLPSPGPLRAQGSAAARRGAGRSNALAAGSGFIRKGTKATVRMRLTAKGRAALRSRRVVRAQLVLIAANAQGKRRTTRRTVTLRR